MTFRTVFVNSISCCNLLSGCLSIIFASTYQFDAAFLFILLGSLFDYFDGMTARLLNVSNEIGVEIDSLSDDITFGLAPTLILFFYLYPRIGWFAGLCLLMAAFSAVRLAIFNTDPNQKTQFIGLATPANAIFWGGFISFLSLVSFEPSPLLCGLFVLFSWVSCYLLIAHTQFFSLKFKDFSWSTNKLRYIFLIVSFIIILIGLILVLFVDISNKFKVWMSLTASVIIVWYILYNFLFNLSATRGSNVDSDVRFKEQI